jgi:hypothetical protein
MLSKEREKIVDNFIALYEERQAVKKQQELIQAGK